ncbi:hypothetical protein SeMB42_g02742 [Synchytrium endobioticum]|nr:hypothetical protein SeMB42_g02742 [Synchytrium endobioticum]
MPKASTAKSNKHLIFPVCVGILGAHLLSTTNTITTRSERSKIILNTESFTPQTNLVVSSYEDKIRKHSHPFKVFQYFASETRDGTSYMTVLDLIRSLTPSSAPSAPSSPTIPPESLAFFKLADIDADGLISYDEYLFFLALLATPEKSWHVAFRLFDEDGDGHVSLKEFKQIVKSNMRASSAKALGTRERVTLSSNTSLVRLFFGSDGTQPLSRARFTSFMTRLHTEVSRLEFATYAPSTEGGRHTISAADFGRAVVAYDGRYGARLHAYRGRDDRRISFLDFLNFDAMVRNHLADIELAVKLYGHAPLDRDRFKRIIQTVAFTSLTEPQLDVIYFLFDPTDKELGRS